MADLHKFKDHFVLLLEAGFIAVNQADEDAAIKLFKASELLNPSSTLPKIGLGYLHFHKLELKKACELFKEVIDKEPNNEMARTLLGMSLSLTPNNIDAGEKILHEVVEKGSTSDVKNVANSAITFVEKFVKKAPSPFDTKRDDKKKK